MKNKRINIILVLLLIVPLVSFNDTKFTTAKLEVVTSQPILNDVPPIVIDDDSDFSIYPGYGNETHPYIIDGLTIIAESLETGINITGTTKHFVIRNNNIRTSGLMVLGYVGIYLCNIAPNTAKIENNYIATYGILFYAENATGLTIEDNTLKRGSSTTFTQTGIYLVDCPFAYVSNNVMYDTNNPTAKDTDYSEVTLKTIETGIWIGAYLINCSDSTFIGNSIDLEGNHIIALSGLTFRDSDRILIEMNDIRNVRMEETQYETFERGGIELQDSNDIIVFNNTVEYTEKTGLQISECNNILISNNTFGDFETSGITTSGSNNATIIYNYIQNSPSYAINIGEDSSNHTIHHNHFIDNKPSGPSQAFDKGTGNIWYDNVTEEGNWWIGDWYGGPYTIAGTAGSEDLYPLGDPMTIPEFSSKIITLILLMSISIAVVPIFRRKKN